MVSTPSSTNDLLWEFSPLYRHQHTLLHPTLPQLIQLVPSRVVLRSSTDLSIIRTWALPAPATAAASKLSIVSFSISPTAPHLVVVHSSDGIAYVLDPEKEDLVAKLMIGAEGATEMDWSPTGQALVVTSNYHLRLSLHQPLSAPTAPTLHILNPKLSHATFAFRPDNKYLAVLERQNSRDCVGIYSCAPDFKLLRHFNLSAPTTDIAGLSFSPCSRYLALWESSLDYRLHIYSADGRKLATFEPYATSGTSSSGAGAEEESEVEKKRDERSKSGFVGLGIRTVVWHPSGEWIAVGGWDNKVRVLTRHTWHPVTELSPPPKLSQSTPLLGTIWSEPKDWIEATRSKAILSFESLSTPLTLPTLPHGLKPDPTKLNPKIGIDVLLFSSSGRWIAVTSQSTPRTLYIYHFLLPSPNPSFLPRLHSTIIFEKPPTEIKWRPGDLDLEGEGTDFNPTSMEWGSSGELVVLKDKETYAVAYPVEGGQGDAERTWSE
ncbi:WD repeat domain 8 [Pseudohyphozyma bogoriensis]|nr:WD repeat domain 8 [Pseudohyphozyma bogoriensis]